MSLSSKQCFPPVVDADTEVLILGSLPGDASLSRAQYYGHPQNQFWRLLGAVLREDLAALAYPERLAALQVHGYGLWDVIATAQRPGSLDSAIRNADHNDLASLIAQHPRLKYIGFNGKTAARIGRKQLLGCSATIILLDLPSSSPAYTQPFEVKLSSWLQLPRPQQPESTPR
ncbi:DNA-deoxyinosine glycosylase [Parachitinimonas caeni]|uniref:DNA-deoxyinosine glycosylase n=1 Tax=Parachitinimonas caeni TaxID=3031301 RepID=A0ABT7DTK3_9NEIS|nr:DNA-deoxyinosine glycosylase [Parachitinimonas caeni]MDK2123409.1 DNA-deoxyinosine glycosylase [Parachitinimonas caeni]